MPPRKTSKGRGKQAVRNNSGGMPGWGWAVIGILAGAILMAIVLRGSFLPLQRGDRNAPAPNAQATAKSATDPGVASDQPEPDKPKKPTYDFYSVLSEKEVRIPDAEISAQAQAEARARQQAATQQAQQVAQQKAAAPAAALPPSAPNAPSVPSEKVTAVPAAPTAPAASGASGYLLQVGAFPSAGDAEALKAKLALQGFVANVQTVKVGGQNYNRVRLGPFKSATDLESTKQRLQGAGISAIALKEGN
jgi:cell division protein FtsN